MLRPRKNTLAFTLLELIVVIVVLGVLAAIAVPTFKAVIDRSHDKTAEASLAAYAREVQALAAFEGEGFTPEEFNTAEGDLAGLAAGPGVLAALAVDARRSTADLPVQARRGTPEQRAIVSYTISDDTQSAAAAAISASGNCVGVRFDRSSTTVVEMPPEVETCTGNTALTGSAVAGGEVLSPLDPDADAPLTPSGLTAAATGTTVKLSWNAAMGALSYEVHQEGAAGPVTTTTSAQATLTIPHGTTTTFWVVAVNGNGKSSPSPSVTVTIVPEKPVISSVTVEGSEAVVSWGAVASATGYNVYRDASDTIAYTAIGNTTTTARFPIDSGSSAVFVVKAANAGGLSEGSDPVGTTATPAVPQNVVATLNGSVATITWDAVSGATGYDVHYSDTSTLVGTSINATLDVSLSAGDTVSFVVRAKNGGGTSAASVPSNTVSLTPAAPTGLAVVLDGLSAGLSWNAATGADSYTVQRKTDAGEFVLHAVGITGTTYTDSALSAGTTYTYRVASTNEAGTGAPGSEVAVSTAPASTSLTLTSVVDTTSTVSWSEVHGATGYTLLTSTSSDMSGATRTPVTGTSATTTGTEGSSLYHQIEVSSAGGTSLSNVVRADYKPAAFTISSVAQSGSSVTVSWGASSGHTGYVLTWKRTSTGATAQLSVAATATGATATGLVEGEAYTFVVSALAGHGNHRHTPSYGKTLVPAAPTNVTASVDGSTVTLTWSAPHGATKYHIARNGTYIAFGVTATTYTETHVPGSHNMPGGVHTYYVQGVNAGGAGPSGSATAAVADYDSTILATSGLSSYWEFDEPAGSTTAADSKGGRTLNYEKITSANAAGGNVPPGATIPTAGAPKVIASTGITSNGGTSVNIPSDSAGFLQNKSVSGMPTSAFTLEAWYTCSGTDDQYIFHFGTLGIDNAIILGQGTDGKLVVYVNNGSQSFPVPFCDDKPHHVAVTWTASTYKATVYLDGVNLGTTAALTNTTIPSSGYLAVGNDQDGNSTGIWIDPNQTFRGSADGVALYNRVLSSTEIVSHYKLG